MSAGRKIKTKSQSWNTPKKYVDIISEFFDGEILLDPCDNEYSIVDAKTKFRLPIDGLVQEWNYSTIFVNPPYGKDKTRNTSIKDWVKKCCETNKKYNSEILLLLIPVATNTTHWKQYIFNCATGICFLNDTRLKFLEDGIESKKRCANGMCNDLLWK